MSIREVWSLKPPITSSPVNLTIPVQLNNTQDEVEQRRLLRAAGEILDQLKITSLSTRSYIEYWDSYRQILSQTLKEDQRMRER